jgi:hypothetical protein
LAAEWPQEAWSVVLDISAPPDAHGSMVVGFDPSMNELLKSCFLPGVDSSCSKGNAMSVHRPMSPSDVAKRFNGLYLGDAMLQHVELRIASSECLLTLDRGMVLEPGGTIFAPKASFAPAVLSFNGVRTISCEGGQYQLHSTVVDFGAEASAAEGYVAFSLHLTGGTDADAFMIKVRIEAADFTLGDAGE